MAERAKRALATSLRAAETVCYKGYVGRPEDVVYSDAWSAIERDLTSGVATS
jgi:hypothetical protein